MPTLSFDVWNQSLLTDVIRRPAEGRAPGAAEDTSPQLGAQIAPMVSLAARKAKLRVAEILPFGKGQFRAPDATPLMFKPSVSWSETLIELALLDEMEMISEEDWINLNSPDENIRKAVGTSLVDKGRILKLRNERLTEWMRWQAFQGSLTIPYNNGASSLYIDYGLPSGHKPTASVLWSNTASADPVTDVQSWSDTIAAATGFHAKKLHMNLKTYNYLVNNAAIRNSINFYSNGASSIIRPRREDILALFESVYTGFEIIINDNGYREVGQAGVGVGSLTKYLPDGKVLVTPDYSLDGVNIAETLDGLVQVPTAYNETAIRQGEQAWVLLHQLSGTHFLRYASARIPRILIPQAFMFCTVA